MFPEDFHSPVPDSRSHLPLARPGGLLLLGGRLADTFGRRRMLRAGLAVFAAASLASGLAHSGIALVTARGF